MQMELNSELLILDSKWAHPDQRAVDQHTGISPLLGAGSPTAPTDLQCDPVLHQEPNLDVHQVQVFLQLLVAPDLGHHFSPQSCDLQLLLEIQVTLVQ